MFGKRNKKFLYGKLTDSIFTVMKTHFVRNTTERDEECVIKRERRETKKGTEKGTVKRKDIESGIEIVTE